MPVAGDDGHVEIAGFLKFFQCHSGSIIFIYKIFRFNHQVFHANQIIEILVEDDVAMVIHDEQALEDVLIIDNYKKIALALGYDVHVGAQGAVRGHSHDIGVHKLVPLQLAQRELVLVVGLKISFIGQRLGINRVFLKRIDADIGAGGGDHQRDKQRVAAGQFRNEEHGGHGGLHHARHHAGHTCEDEVDVGKMRAQ